MSILSESIEFLVLTLIYLRHFLIFPSHLRLSLSRDLLLVGFPVKYLKVLPFWLHSLSILFLYI
jgi:hypothetical protein